jgi:two-component system OmpR family response regulator
MKILVIDDTEEILELISAHLTAAGHETSTTNDGHKGIEMIKANTFDVVLLDVAMPEFSGLDVLDSLEKTGHILLTKIIIITASEIPSEDLTNLMKRGVAAWIRKPINFDILLGRLKTLCP